MLAKSFNPSERSRRSSPGALAKASGVTLGNPRLYETEADRYAANVLPIIRLFDLGPLSPDLRFCRGWRGRFQNSPVKRAAAAELTTAVRIIRDQLETNGN